MGAGGQCHVLAALPPGKIWYPLYSRLGRPQDRSGRVRKISPPLRFDLQTVQRIASHYTDWAIMAHYLIYAYTLHRVIILSDNNQLPLPVTSFSVLIGPINWPPNTRQTSSGKWQTFGRPKRICFSLHNQTSFRSLVTGHCHTVLWLPMHGARCIPRIFPWEKGRETLRLYVIYIKIIFFTNKCTFIECIKC